MIIACTVCPAEYSVPDAKIQGKKVRVTCKHCGTGIIVDGTMVFAPAPPPAPAPAPAPQRAPAPPPAPAPVVERVLPPFELPRAFGTDDDATRVMQRPQDFSVHEEPTVVGRIPIEALEAERRFSQRTVPPPTDNGSSVPSPDAAPTPPPPPSIVIDSSIELRPPTSPGAARSAFPAPPSSAAFDLGGLSSDADDAADVARLRDRNWPWVLGTVLLVAAALLAAQALR